MFDRIKSLITGGKAMTPDDLVRNGKLLAEAIAAAPGDAAQLKPLFASPAAPAAAIIAGLTGAAMTAELVPLLAQEGLPGRAAAWALGRLGAQAQLLAAVADGGLDQRDNAYWGLAVLAAAGKASSDLAPALRARVAAEIAKAKSGGTGLGEHAVRALAVLGDAEAGALAQAVVDGDRFCDRFELQRIKKAVTDGRDREAVRLFSAEWTVVFADQLYVEPAKPAEKPAEQPAAKAPGKAPAKAPAKMPVPVSDAPPSYDLGGDPGEGEAPPEAGEPPAGGGAPVDWKAFLASPEAAALQPQVKQMAGQLGQLLEKLAQQAVGAQFTDLSRDEFAALLTQVLPQALPPQHVQAALSPHALNAYQALAKFLHRTGAATQGDGLLQGVKLVRQLMTEQMRRSGILGGPDYSDPDEKPVIKK
jgi:hypothetical protein